MSTTRLLSYFIQYMIKYLATGWREYECRGRIIR